MAHKLSQNVIDNIAGLVPPLASQNDSKTVNNQFKKLLNDLAYIFTTQTHKSTLLPRKKFIRNENVQEMIELSAQIITDRSSVNLAQTITFDLIEEVKYGTFLAACFHMTSIEIRDLEFEISDQKSKLYQTYIKVFDNLLKITNKLLLLFIGKFSEIYIEKKGLVSVLTFLKIKKFISLLKTSNNTNVLKSLIENLRIQSRYADKDPKLWLNFNVFGILLDLSQTEIGTDNYIQIAGYTVMANIGTDKQIEKCIRNGIDSEVPIYKLIFTCLMSEISEIAEKLNADKYDTDKEFEVHEMQFNDDGKFIICPIDVYKGQTVGGKLLALYNLAINKKAANLFFEHIQSLSLILKHSKELEKRICLRMLTQLCFYENKASIYLFEHGLYDYIKEMNTKESHVKMLQKSKEHIEYAYQLLNKHFTDIHQNEKFRRTFLKLKVQKSFQPSIESDNKPIIKHILVIKHNILFFKKIEI